MDFYFKPAPVSQPSPSQATPRPAWSYWGRKGPHLAKGPLTLSSTPSDFALILFPATRWWLGCSHQFLGGMAGADTEPLAAGGGGFEVQVSMSRWSLPCLSVCISSVGYDSADMGGSSILFRALLSTWECILTRHCRWNNTSVYSLCCTTFPALRRITSVHPFLSNSSTEKLVASMVRSRMDYCNATFAGVSDEQITCIQKVQNNTTQLILKNQSVIMSHHFWKNSIGSQ